MRGGFVFHEDCSLDTDRNGQRSSEKLEAVFLDTNSLYLSAMPHNSLPCGNYKWLENCCDPNFTDIVAF
jgi:hypothetical protein